nr:putative integron gene cassette protein [uncultured bacterium]
MKQTPTFRKSMSLSAAVGLALPALFLAYMLMLYAGIVSDRLNPLDAGIFFLIGAPVCIILGTVSSIYAVTENRCPRWAAVSGLVVNGLVLAYALASLLLAA